MAVRELIKDGKRIGFDVQVSVRHPTTKKRHFLRRRAANKWEANQLEITLKKELHDLLAGTLVPTWKELIAAYEQNCLINKAASTKFNELSILSHHVDPHLHLKLINQISESDVRAILQRIDPERSLSLKYNIRKTLANVFNYAIECRYIVENPCRRIKLDKIPEPSLNILTDQQIRVFLQKAEQTEVEWFPIWAFGIYTGMRNGELVALRYKHIQHNDGKPIIKIQESWTRKGGFQPYTKNKQIRTVPINRQLQRVIDQLKRANPDNCGPDDFVLPRMHSWQHGDAAKELRAFLRGCGLPSIRFHDLRSCFISQCLLHGVQPSVVMKMVGHADMKTMMRYCRHTGSDVLGQTDILDFS